MPIILTPPETQGAGRGATLAGQARTAASRRAVLTGRAASRVGVRGATLTGHTSRPLARGATLVGVKSSGLPVEILAGRAPLSTLQVVAGLPGTVLDWTYTHSFAGETLDVTAAGRFGAHLPTVTVSAQAQRGLAPVDALPERTFATFGQEPQVNTGQNRTTFRFVGNFEQALRGARLPELVPWVLTPSPAACPPVRQRLSVSALVRAVMREHVDPGFTLNPDPLVSAEWVEGLVEYSTNGLTPQDVWDATYGALGMVLGVRRWGSGRRLAGCFPQPLAPTAGTGVPFHSEYVTDLEETQERLQTPTRITLTGAPKVTELNAERFLNWASDDPALPELQRELLPNGEWIDPEVREGTAVTAHGWRRLNGQVTAEVTVVTDDVRVSELVDGTEVTKEFRGAATSVTQTTTTYDPECPVRPLRQRTRTRSWGYAVDTVPGSTTTTGPGLYLTRPTGDLLALEDTFVTFEYAAQGYLAREVRVSDQLATAQQEDAFNAPGQRQPMQGRDLQRTVEDIRYQPDGAGRWRRTRTVTRRSLTPIFDLETQEAVRLVDFTRTVPEPPQISDQAPPSYECEPCGGVYHRTITDPTGVVVRAGDAGFGEERTVNVPTLNPLNLAVTARLILAAQWHRRVRTVTLEYPVGLQPGDDTPLGVVREVRMRGTPGRVQSTVTFAELDTLYGSPAGMPTAPHLLDRQRGRALVISGRPGGARVRLVRGWDDGQPIIEDGFVRTRDASVRPGEEIEWEQRSTGLVASGAS